MEAKKIIVDNKKKKRIKKLITKTVIYFILLTVALSMLIPFIWMVSTSLMNDLEVYQFPPKFIPSKLLWSNYPEALKALPFDRFFFNSTVTAILVTTGQLFFCSMAAYAFSRIEFPGRNKVFMLYLSTMMVPGVVTLIPSFIIINNFGWIDTFWALIIPLLSNVWGIFLLRQFFMTIPISLSDSARIDGASEFTIYLKIIVPLSKPALATLGVFTLMGTWRALLWPLIVTRSMKMRTIEVGISAFHSLYVTNWPYQMSVAVVAMIPILIFFFFAQKYFIEGIALTGMKG